MYNKRYAYSRDLDYLLKEYLKLYDIASKHPKEWTELINILEGQLKVITALKYAYEDLGLYIKENEDPFQVDSIIQHNQLDDFKTWFDNLYRRVEMDVERHELNNHHVMQLMQKIKKKLEGYNKNNGTDY